MKDKIRYIIMFKGRVDINDIGGIFDESYEGSGVGIMGGCMDSVGDGGNFECSIDGV